MYNGYLKNSMKLFEFPIVALAHPLHIYISMVSLVKSAMISFPQLCFWFPSLLWTFCSNWVPSFLLYFGLLGHCKDFANHYHAQAVAELIASRHCICIHIDKSAVYVSQLWIKLFSLHSNHIVVFIESRHLIQRSLWDAFIRLCYKLAPK